MLGIYCRRSGFNDNSASIEVQQEQGIKFAKENGFKYKVFTDVGISGNKDEIKDRPEFAKLYDGINKKVITEVYAYDQSRLERNSTVWNLLVTVMLKTGCKYYPNGQILDLDKPENRFLTKILSASNELYSSITSQKVILAHDKNASKGKTHGVTPYGYKRSDEGYFEVVPDQSKIVKKIYKLSLEGQGTYTIANILNDENTPTKFNGFDGVIIRKDEFTEHITEHKKSDVKWRGNVIYDMIVNTIYKGKRKWKDNFYDVPAIISESDWDKVNRNLKQNKKNVGKKAEYSYLLNGIIFCSHCGKEYRGKKRPKGNDNSYKCTGRRPPNPCCNLSRGISLPKIETFIVKHLFHKEKFKQDLLNQKTSSTQSSILEKKLKSLQSLSKNMEIKLEIANDRLYDPDLKDDPKIKQDYLNFKEKIEQTKLQIIAIQERIAIADDNVRKKRIQRIFDSYVDDIDFISLKKLVHSLIKKIQVHWNIDDFGKGFYIFQIDYHLYDERIIYTTDIRAMKWLLMSRYRRVATNEAELEHDKLLADEVGWEINDNFKGLETRGSGYDSIIELKREEFIHFD